MRKNSILIVLLALFSSENALAQHDSIGIHSRVEELRDAYVSNGHFDGTEEEFYKWFYAKGKEGYFNRKNVYETLTEEESSIGKSYEEFIVLMGLHVVEDVDTDIYTSPIPDNNTFAIIFGNEDYKHEESVPYAANDANIFSKYVNRTLGVPYNHIRLVENAGYNDLRIAINWLVQAMKVCKGKGRAIVYYAGHGIPNEKDGSIYLLPVDGYGNDTESAYSIKDLYDKLSNMEAKSVTVFLDACFSGAKREGDMLASSRGVAIKTKPTTPSGNIVVFSAAQGSETAYPYKEKQHGLFTYYLLKKLKESKGEITLGELSDYLSEEVGRESFVINGKIQTPTTISSNDLRNIWRGLKIK